MSSVRKGEPDPIRLGDSGKCCMTWVGKRGNPCEGIVGVHRTRVQDLRPPHNAVAFIFEDHRKREKLPSRPREAAVVVS